jgi:hypothetical protein
MQYIRLTMSRLGHWSLAAVTLLAFLKIPISMHGFVTILSLWILLRTLILFIGFRRKRLPSCALQLVCVKNKLGMLNYFAIRK